MNSNSILFLIVVSLVAYSLVATYFFWMKSYDIRFLKRRIAGVKADISTLATAYETLRSLLERTGKSQAEALSIIAEANKRIDRLEDKRKAYQAPKAQAPRTPRPLQGKQTNEKKSN